MSQYLPYSGFKWLSQKEIDKFDVHSIAENSSDRCILKAYLEYPDKLHKLRNDHLFVTEKLEISNDMLPHYCSNIADKYEMKVGGVKKLLPNLGNKNKYVCRSLKKSLVVFITRMKLTKFHRVLKFNQAELLKKYIDFNTDKRKNAANIFEKDFFKLMINSVYEETMENIRNRINVRLVNNAKDYIKYTSKPSFVPQKIFGETFVAVHEIKPVLMLDKPIYVECSILDLSKYFMYNFHYN